MDVKQQSSSPHRPGRSSLPFWRQLRWSLILSFIILAVVPVTVVESVTLSRTSDQARKQAFNQLESVAELKTQEILSWLQDNRMALDMILAGEELRKDRFIRLATLTSGWEGQQIAVTRILQETDNEHPGFSEFFFYSTQDGRILASSNTAQIDQIVTSQPYFEPSILRNYIQPPYYEIGTGELTIILSRPVRDTNGKAVGVLAGRLDLTTLGQIMTERAGLGQTGETYLVSLENNYLLTPSRHEGYSLTRTYHSAGIDRALLGENGSGTYQDYTDQHASVFGVYRWVPELQSGMLAEVRRSEALSAFDDARNSSAILTILAALVAVMVGLYAATRVSGPIASLTQVATRIAQGDLAQRAAVRQRNELGVLAAVFNNMTDQLQELVGGLEARVAARTRDLFLTLEVGQLATSINREEDLLTRVVDFIRERFDLYYTQVYLLDDVKQNAVLKAGTGEVGQLLLAHNHRLALRETSIVARTVQTRRPVLVTDTQASEVHKPNPLLPDTRSEVAIPLIVGTEILGVLDMQAGQAGIFNEDNLPVFEAMASQLAASLRAAHAYEQAQTAVERAAAINRRLTRERWESYLGRAGEGAQVGYEYDLQAVKPSESAAEPPADGSHPVSQPILLRGEQIGSILLGDGVGRDWTPEERALVGSVAERVALAVEQFRAFDETERHAVQLQTVAEVGVQAATILDVEKLLWTVANLTKENFDLYHAHMYLLDETRKHLLLVAGAGEVGREMVAAGHRIPLAHEHSVVARAARSRQGVVVNDVLHASDFLPNPLLPDTRSEMAIPMIVGERVIGVLDVQSIRLNRFTEDDLRVMETLASQVAAAVNNARLFTQITQAELERAEREALLRSIIDATPDWIFVKDRNFRFSLVNESFAASMNMTPDDFVGKDDYDLFPPHLVEGDPDQGIIGFRLTDAKALSGEVVQIPYDPVKYASGEIRILDTRKLPLRDAQGNIFAMLGFGHDITEIKRAEEALAAERNLLRTLIDHLPDHIYVKDTQGRFTIRNEAGARHMGAVSTDAVIGKTDFDFYPPELAELYHASEQLIIQSGQPLINWEEPIADAEGNRGWILTTKVPLQTKQGEIIGLVGIGRDITELKRSEAIVSKRALELQTVAEVGVQASTILSSEELLWTVSNLTKENFGLYHAHVYLLDDTGKKLVLTAGAGEAGQRMVAAGHTIPLNHARSLVARAARTRQSVIVNDVHATPDFLPNPLLPETHSEMAVPMIVSGEVVGVLDVQSEEREHFSEEDARVQTILASQIAVAIENAHLFNEVQLEGERRARLYDLVQRLSESLDPAVIAQIAVEDLSALLDMPEVSIFHFQSANDTLRMLASSGPIGQSMVDQVIPVADSPDAGRVVETRTVEIETDLRSKDGPRYELAKQAGFTASMTVPILIADQVIGALLLNETRGPRQFTDAEIQLAQSVAFQVGITLQNAYLYLEQVETTMQLREVDRLKSEFLASMSHELRTPLNSIIGYAEVLLDGIDGDLTGDMTEDVGAIHGSGKLLLNLINDILDLAKIEAGQMDLLREQVELKPLVQEVMTTAKVLLMGKPVNLVVEVDESLPRVDADSLRLRQVLSNLITNAIKFTQEGSITVRAERYEADHSLLQISIIDTGIGIKAEHLPLVFERFRQVDQSATRRVGGTGLGLAITRQLIQMHGGDIWVQSEYGAGSIFSFTLPAVQVSEEKV